jgi:zinc protease
MLLRLLRPLLAACAVSLAARAAADPEIKFEKYQLPNGLTVILSEDHRLPQVAVDIWYHVGAANQTPGKSGFAHLFEHMMFSGSKHIQPTAFKVLEQVGASQVNGRRPSCRRRCGSSPTGWASCSTPSTTRS